MAPARRRTRDESEDSEEDVVVDVQSASSQFRVTGSKRQRLSLVNGDAYSGQEDGDDDLEDGTPFRHTRDGTIDDGLPDDVDVELESDDGEDIGLRDIVEKQLKVVKENQPADEGVIEEVFCRNFMCHSKLRVKLGPLINFIIGHNGSGKSAVLTALTLCLGAKATVTNRGGNLKAFIKEGEESCTLSVKIKNQGDLAYQPEIYGRSIIVERHFTRSGTSGFKIKNAEERNISTKRSDLEDIIDFFGLQLDNPMNVLSQDMARQFLSNSTPHDKYKFFIRGTQLEQLDRDYQLMEETLDNTEAKLESREQDIAVLEQRARAAGEKKKLIDRSRTIQDTIKQLQWQHAWAQVEEQEKNLADIDDKIRAEEEHIERLTREAQKKSEEYDECNQTSEAAAQVIEDLRNQLEPIAQEHAANKDRFDENKERITSVHAQQRNIRQDLTGAKKRIARLKQEIQAEHARLEGANGPAHHQKLVELEELRSRVEELRSEQQEHAGRLEQLKAEARSSEENHKASLGPLQEKREARGQEENSLKGLQSEQGQGWRAYHRNTQLLLRAIANEGRFSIKPVGPVGRHIRLLKPEWGSVIERTMGGVAEAYIVTNKTDHGILSELMRRCDCQASIFIGNPQRIDTSRNEPDPAVDTILRVMEFDSDLVRNQLIINQAIEQTVLIKDRDEAANFMFEKGRPRNVKVTICMHERGGGVRFTFTRSGGQSSGPVAAWKAAPRIPTDVEAQIRIQKDRVNEAERDFQEAERRSRELEVVAKCCQSAIKRHVNEQKEHRINLQRIEDEIARLEGEIEADTADDGALNELKLQLETAKEEEETAASSYQDAVNAKDEYNELATELKRRMDTSQAEVDEIKHKIQKTELRSQQRAQQRETALREKNEAIDLLEAAKHDKTELEQQRQAQAEIIQETFIRGAEAIHARVTVEPGMTAAKLDARIDKLAEEQRRFEQEAGGSREEITRAWAQAVQEYKAATRQFKELKRFCTMLKKTLLHRQHRWAAFRKLITSKAKIMFTYMLGERGFRGHILVDHKTKGLDINVEPDLSKSSNKGRQAKTLSGGEKSFSTVCLLLAIWEAMGSPIRCLDEFDVFMDNVNRDISMKMMIQAAGRSVGKQFILITPQAMGNVQFGDDVKIHKMSDPERGQTTLPFGS